MKSISKLFVISVAVLGMGTIGSASAANESAEQTMQQVISAQSQQVTQNLTQQLQLSIKSSLQKIALVKVTEKSAQSSLLVAANQAAKLAKNNLSAEEE